MIWIIGEYAERIDNADELLESFLEGFADENTQVQLQVCVKAAGVQKVIQNLLQHITCMLTFLYTPFCLLVASDGHR